MIHSYFCLKLSKEFIILHFIYNILVLIIIIIFKAYKRVPLSDKYEKNRKLSENTITGGKYRIYKL